MAKRKCRMTEHEIDIHKRAVALRKMTDEQLVNEVEGKNKCSAVVLRSDIDIETAQEILEAHKKNTNPLTTIPKDEGINSHSALDSLLHELTEGYIKGIGKVTTEKIIDYCLEKGYSKYGLREV